jgi:mono/diheme cytochrome c family protein
MNYVKRIVITFILVAVAALEFGCGEGSETNTPSVKLTASAITSQADITAHTHAVSIPFTDLSSAPANDIYQHRSDTSNGHTHVVALSKQQMIDLNNGMRLVLVSSSPNTGTNHTHTWSIQGGDVLYEKSCYNCHSNDKRNHNPMNVSFNTSQSSAVINPGSASLSSSLAAVPDPNYLQSSVVSLDGAALYSVSCASCHGVLGSSTKQNKTFTQIKNAIGNNSGGMGALGSLTDAQLQAIAAALVK